MSPDHEGRDSESRGKDVPRVVDYGRSRSLAWAEGVEHGRDCLDVVKIPPMCVILHKDILARGWGWERVVPYYPVDVEWPEFKVYLADFLGETGKNNTILAKWKPGLVALSVKDAAELELLTDAIHVCVEIEKYLLANFFEDFDLEDIFLSKQIIDRAKQLSDSGCVSSAAAAALMCITKEDELMFELLRLGFDPSETVSLCNMIRRPASNLLLCKGSGSDVDAAAGAMLGIAKEAAWSLDVLRRDYPDSYYEYLVSDQIRQRTRVALTKLEQELACQTAGNGGDTRLGRVSRAGDLNCEESGSMENSEKHKHTVMGMTPKGDKLANSDVAKPGLTVSND